MKITSIDVFMLKYDQPFYLRPVVCRVNTDEGIYGYGESALAFTFGASAAFQMLVELAPLAIGMDPLENEVVWEKIFRTAFWTIGGGAVEIGALSAIDMALWDIKGKAANLPLYKLLGGKQREKLRVYASQLQFGWGEKADNLHDAEAYIAGTQAAMEEGYDCVKLNFIRQHADGRWTDKNDTSVHFKRDFLKLAGQRLAKVRSMIGPDKDIILENHAITDVPTAIEFGRMCEQYDILFYEEAIMPLDPDRMRKVAEGVNIPIASGERIYTRWGFKPFFENGSLQVIQPDLGNCGGITEGKKICDMADTYDISVQTHVCSSPICKAASLHFEAALHNFIIHEHHGINSHPLNAKTCQYNYQPQNGWYEIPELPGISQELSEYGLKYADKVTVK